MDVREKLVELILNADNDKNLVSYDLYELTHERTGCAEYFADYLIANGVTVQKWIPVTERLPKGEDEVLMSTEHGGQVVGYYDSKRREWLSWSDEYSEYYSLCGTMGEVTHWMPLPEPPGEGE